MPKRSSASRSGRTWVLPASATLMPAVDRNSPRVFSRKESGTRFQVAPWLDM